MGSRWLACISVVVTAGLAPSCGGSGARGGSPDATANDGAQEAVSPVDAGVDATGDGSAPTDATTPEADAGQVTDATDAADASSAVTVVGCSAGSSLVTMTRDQVTVAYDLGAGIATFTYGALPKIVGFFAGVVLASFTTS
jgi:hypothetical protein